jgi:hypothetical protein
MTGPGLSHSLFASRSRSRRSDAAADGHERKPEWDDIFDVFDRTRTRGSAIGDRAEFPDSDQGTRDNLGMLIRMAERG